MLKSDPAEINRRSILAATPFLKLGLICHPVHTGTKFLVTDRGRAMASTSSDSLMNNVLSNYSADIGDSLDEPYDDGMDENVDFHSHNWADKANATVIKEKGFLNGSSRFSFIFV